MLHHDNAPFHASFFTREFLSKSNTTFVPIHPTFVCFPLLKMKLKGRHFNINEVIEAESQAVLNTLTDHNFQDALKKLQKRRERCILADWD
jgi:cellulose biosynthesis protein BcsQ